jgi:hypothetical protein
MKDRIIQSEITLTENGFLFDHNSGLTYTLNETGAFIFHLADKGKQAYQILAPLMKEFDIDERTAQRDIDDFFRQLKETGLTA